jgi:hypothetical protein
MTSDASTTNPLEHQLERLAQALDRNERRLQRTERQLRLAGVLAMAAIAVLTFTLQGRPPVQASPATQNTWSTSVEKDIDSAEQTSEQAFESMMKRVKKDLASAENANPAHMVAVILHDMKEMLEAVPRMADDVHRMANDMQVMNDKMTAVPAMADQMQQMNMKMGVMAHGVDNTMGRMGRWMPW